MQCPECGRDFEPHAGRGRQSPFCDVCKPKVRARAAAQRQIRHALAQLSEWVNVLAPEIIKRKEVIAEEQAGRCYVCGKHRKLYMTVDAGGVIRGVCINHTGVPL